MGVSKEQDPSWLGSTPYYGGAQWNGKAWVPYQQGTQATPYSQPYAMPQDTHQAEENFLTNPEFQNWVRNHPTGPEAGLMYSVLGQRQANADTERNFQGALGALQTGNQGQAGSLDQAEASSLSDARRAYGKNVGSRNAELQGRGLYNTTLAGSMKNREAESYGRTAGAVRGAYAQQRGQNQYAYGRDVSNLYGQRASQSASSNFYSNFARANATPQTPRDNSAMWGAAGSVASAALLALVASDARIKTNVAPIDSALGKLLNVRGVEYDYTDTRIPGTAPGRQVGVIAQELEAEFPSMVETGADGIKRVTMRGIEGVLIEALREINHRVRALESENAALRGGA